MFVVHAPGNSSPDIKLFRRARCQVPTHNNATNMEAPLLNIHADFIMHLLCILR